MPSKSWGTPLTVQQYLVIGEDEEIPQGEYAYVFNQQVGSANIWDTDWEAMMNGDLSSIKNKIETEIAGTRVQWIQVLWSKAVYVKGVGYPPPRPYYVVEGFKIEAIVKNEAGASLTGAEIVLIIMALAFMAVVIGALVMVGWVVWRVMEAAEAIGGPAGTIIVGIGVLILLCLFLLILFGATLGIGKKGVTIGK